MSNKKKNNKGKRENEGEEEKQEIQNINLIQELNLGYLGETTQIDFNSQLFVQYLKLNLKKLQKINHNDKINLSIFGENETFKVISIKLQEEDNSLLLNQVNNDTVIKIIKERDISDEEEKALNILNNQFQNLQLNHSQEIEFGGYQQQLQTITEVINLKLINENPNLNLKGILIHGPAGVGKSVAVQKVISQFPQIPLITLTPHDLLKCKDHMQQKLLDTIQLVRLRQPTILLLEELDFISSSKSQNKDLFYTLQSELDSLNSLQKILIIATTNKIDEIDKSLRRGGRLDIDVRFDMPQANDRYEIFQTHLSKLPHQITTEDLQLISKQASGFVGSDLAQIIRNAQIKSIQNKQDKISKLDLEQAIIEAKPLSIQDLIVEVPKVKWDEIGGNQSIKFQVRQCVEWPLKFAQKFEAMKLKPPTGILLHGPPGCSKTMIAKALATESGLNFIAIKGPELFSKYVGDTEKAIREIFRKAKLSSPSIIFFDEIDAMTQQRGGEDTSVSDRALCQLLNEMDGVETKAHVIVVGATNRIDTIDKALLRPGRFDRLIYVPLPNDETRQQIFEINLKNMPITQEINYQQLVQQSIGMSGAEISLICKEAGLKALSEDQKIETESIENIKITMDHLTKSIKEVRERGQSQIF